MAVGQNSAQSPEQRYLTTEIFRCFWIALDPRKLLVAALGILATSIGWWFLSIIFNNLMKEPTAPESRETIAAILGKKADGTSYTDEELDETAKARHESNLAKYNTLKSLAGENGKLRLLPWDEDRGPNPYLFLTTMLGGNADEKKATLSNFTSNQWLVLLEPVTKLIYPVIKITDPHATFGTKVYCFLCLVWGLAVWAFAGGVITRVAAVQLSGKDTVSLSEAVRYVQARYVSYLSAPLLPIAGVLAVVIVLIIFGLLGMIPLVGDVLVLGLLYVIYLIAGLIMAFLLLGLIGYPLMYPTLSVEGSDTFDALSRAYSYVITAPGKFLWYCFVAVVFGIAVTFVVVLSGSLAVYLGKWAVNQTAKTVRPSHAPEYLFVNAPRTLGWRELLTRDSALELKTHAERTASTDKSDYSEYKNPKKAEEYLKSYYGYHTFSSWLVSFWLGIALLAMLGFSYSYFWSAATTIYLLMRKHVDDTELDEVYLENRDVNKPMTPPVSLPTDSVPPAPGATAAGSVGQSLPMVPPTPPATVPFPTGTMEKKPDVPPQGPNT